MENIWLRHQSGLKQSPNKVFMVELPPPSLEGTWVNVKAKISEPVEYAMEYFDSVWCGEYCSRCGRRQYCSDPIK